MGLPELEYHKFLTENIYTPQYPGIDLAEVTADELKVNLGKIIADKYGNLFRLVKAGEDLAKGDIVAYKTPTALTTHATQNYGATAEEAKSAIVTTSGLSENYEGELVAIPASENNYGGTIKTIVKNTQTGSNDALVISKYYSEVRGWDGDYLSAGTIAAGINIHLIQPWVVLKAGSAATGKLEQIPIGVAVDAASAGQFTLVQIGGIGHCKVTTGGTESRAVGEPIYTSASAGVAGVTANELVGYVMEAVSSSQTEILVATRFAFKVF